MPASSPEQNGHRAPEDWNPGTTQRRLPRPRFTPQLSITEYPESTLVEIVAYVRSDGILRSADEEMRLVMNELGFARKGNRIEAAIRRAQTAADARAAVKR